MAFVNLETGQVMAGVKGKSGGKREGSGRKVNAEWKRKQIGIRFPVWLNEWLEAQPGNKTELVEQAIIKHYKLKPPSKEVSDG